MSDAQKSASALEITAKAIGLIVPLTFALSIVHDLGFYKALGLNFTDIPLTWSDQLRFSISWLPQALMWMLIGGLVNLAFDRIEQAESEEVIVSKLPAKARKFRKWGNLAPGIAFATVGFLWFLFGDSFYSSGGIFLAFSWMLFCIWILTNHLIRSRYPKPIWLGILFLPAVLILIFFSDFYSYKFQDLDAITIQFKDTSKGVLTGSRIIRNYEKGLLITDNSQLRFISADQIEIQTRKQLTFKFHGVIGSFKN